MKVLQTAMDQDRSLQDLGAACAEDPGLTVELLRVANSARYASTDPVSSVPQAVVKLGSRTVRAVVMTYIIRAMVSQEDLGGFDIRLFWSDCLQRAVTAQILADRTAYEDPSEAYTLGLTQELGVLLLAMRYPKVGRDIQELRGVPSGERDHAERQVAGRSGISEFWASELVRMLPHDLCMAVRKRRSPPLDGRRASRLARLAWATDILFDLSLGERDDAAVEVAQQALLRIGVDEPIDELAREIENALNEWTIDIGPAVAVESVTENDADHPSTSEGEISALESLLREHRSTNNELRESNRRLMYIAGKDPLTGLGTPRSLLKSLDDVLHRSLRAGRPLSILVLDIDHFKRINDNNGRELGDVVLRSVARQIAGIVRQADVVGRLGGEEFCVLLGGASRTSARVVAERIRTAIEKSPVVQDKQRVQVTVSIGGATMRADEPPDDPSEIIDLADRAMFLAKCGGRNAVRWYNRPRR